MTPLSADILHCENITRRHSFRIRVGLSSNAPNYKVGAYSLWIVSSYVLKNQSSEGFVSSPEQKAHKQSL